MSPWNSFIARSPQVTGHQGGLLLPFPLSLFDPLLHKLLEEGSKKAELGQETKLNPLLPAFVQCQKHSRNCFPARDQACYFSFLCSMLLSSCRDGVDGEIIGFHTQQKEI